MSGRRKEILALIPGRSGSKRVRNKNIRLLGGKPLIAYTIDAAKKAKLVTRVIVTTDSTKIANIAERYGAEAPFLRPKSIAQGDSTEYAFHLHALNWLRDNEGYVPDLIVNLYPTAPFRQAASIDKAIKMMLAHPHADSLRSVKLCSEHPFKMWKPRGIYLDPFVHTATMRDHTRSYHLLPRVFIQNASIYITRTAAVRRYRSSIGKRILMFEMDERESFDINTPLDFVIAEGMIP
jgi:N-acylneuraminate cytidylyltransferase